MLNMKKWPDILKSVKIAAPLLGCLLLLVASLWAYHLHEGAESADAGSEFTLENFSESTDRYAITAEIPVTGQSAVDVALRAQLNALFDAFAAKANRETPSSPYRLRVLTQMWHTGDGIASFSFEAFAYTGGKRGSSAVFCRSFDLQSGDSVSLSSASQDEERTLSELTRAIQAQYASWVDTGLTTRAWLEEGLSPAAEVAACAVFTPEGLRVFLEPYRLGPWQCQVESVLMGYEKVSAWLTPAFYARLTDVDAGLE